MSNENKCFHSISYKSLSKGFPFSSHYSSFLKILLNTLTIVERCSLFQIKYYRLFRIYHVFKISTSNRPLLHVKWLWQNKNVSKTDVQYCTRLIPLENVWVGFISPRTISSCSNILLVLITFESRVPHMRYGFFLVSVESIFI